MAGIAALCITQERLRGHRTVQEKSCAEAFCKTFYKLLEQPQYGFDERRCSGMGVCSWTRPAGSREFVNRRKQGSKL